MDIDDDYIYFNSWVDLGKQIPYTSEDMKEIKWQKYKRSLRFESISNRSFILSI